jgi:hypothetical protein
MVAPVSFELGSAPHRLGTRALGVVVWLCLFSRITACSADPAADADESCTNGASCVVDDDCADSFRCNGTSCTKILCLKDSEPCDTDDICVSRQCPDTLSRSGRVCWSGPRRVGMWCTSSSPCGGDLICNDCI